MVEGDSFLLSVSTVGIMLPLSEVKRTEGRQFSWRWNYGTVSPNLGLSQKFQHNEAA